jgi:aryl-alcohol dehydrogenase-like predicted oxidoreductase
LETSRKLGVPSYVSLQPHYNLADRTDFERNLEPFCREHHVGVISYFSLAKGFLSGKYRSEADLGKSPRGQGVKAYLNERGYRILKALDEVAARHGSTPARVSLAWLMAKPAVTAPIASATSMEQLGDLIGAVQLKLSADDMRALDTASA